MSRSRAHSSQVARLLRVPDPLVQEVLAQIIGRAGLMEAVPLPVRGLAHEVVLRLADAHSLEDLVLHHSQTREEKAGVEDVDLLHQEIEYTEATQSRGPAHFRHSLAGPTGEDHPAMNVVESLVETAVGVVLAGVIVAQEVHIQGDLAGPVLDHGHRDQEAEVAPTLLYPLVVALQAPEAGRAVNDLMVIIDLGVRRLGTDAHFLIILSFSDNILFVYCL